ncbi:MAG: acetolactate decarboxylase [Bacteroidia bacterium]
MRNKNFNIKSYSQVLIIVFLSAFTSCTAGNKQENKDQFVYECPMKCEGDKTYNSPGKCPVCGMDLKKVEVKPAKAKTSNVKIAGAMMNVMHKGELFGTISLDTISNKKHLYGLGPVDYLKGEILINDGICYISKVTSQNQISVSESYNVKAPFFVYANVPGWKETLLPDSISTIKQLEVYLDAVTKNSVRPFTFRVTAMVDEANIHIVNLPTGAEVHSPEDAHQNQKAFNIRNKSVELIGFFSTEHAGVFTHHDSFVHVHLITDDKTEMGHLDDLILRKGSAKLYLPE